MILRDLTDDKAHYRFIVPRWSFAPTSGAGAALKGGRFNRPGLEALYVSASFETAAAEYRQAARLLPPGVVVTFLVSRLRIVDFSQGYVAGVWDPIWSEASCNWRKMAFEEGIEPPSWVLGDLVLEAGASGLLFPSTAHPGGINLVLYRSSELPPEQLRVHDPGRALPTTDASWPSP